MVDLIGIEWLALAAVVILALLIAWWIWGRGPGPERRRAETADVLTPGAAPAERNTLLVEAPPPSASFTTAPIAGVAPDIMGGMGEVIAAATAQEIGEAVQAEEERGVAPAAGERDDLTRIKGIGPKLVARLGELGIRRYDQIAAWSDEDVARIDAQLGPFQGRIVRDNWIEQCRYLAAGDIAGYEARFGKL